MGAPVRDEGRKSAPLVLIGEAPGRQEEEKGRPFVGKSGAKLSFWWRDVGLSRSDFYITNTYPYRPPNNNIKAVPKDELRAWGLKLHERIANLDDPAILIPTGNVALYALMGMAGITKYRGSILEYEDQRGRIMRVIPTIHPAALFRTTNPGRTEKHCRLDWKRIAHELTNGHTPYIARSHHIKPTIEQCRNFLEQARHEATVMSIDIETSREAILCVGFSYDPTWSFVIPLRDARWWQDDNERSTAKSIIASLCGLPCAKVLQNGLFDAFWLSRTEGIEIANYTWDLKAMHHAFDPVDDHNLAYMQSVYTREPFHKDEAKDPELMAQYASNFDALQTYCGLDNCVQRELFDALHNELERTSQLAFYLSMYPPLFQAVLDTMLGGMRTASRTRSLSWLRIKANLIGIQDRLTEIAGFKMYAKKGLSPIAMRRLLFDGLGVRPMINRKTKRTTLDEVAIRKMQIKHPEHSEIFGLILDHRRQAQLIQFFDEQATDPDGYIRCEYTFTTEAGRLASRKNPMRSGRNLQNIDRDPNVRGTFLADPGHVMLEVDLSQAESRVVYVLSGHPDLVDIARKPSSAFDQHSYNASLIFGVPTSDVTKEQRYFGKRTVHGAQRGLRGDKMAGELLKDGYIRTPEECQRMIDRYLGEFPGILNYFKWVQQQVWWHKQLVNSWGRIWNVTYEHMDDDLYRRAYSFLPQSEVADLLNQWGFVALHQRLQSWEWEEARIAAQVHDSLLISCRPDDAWDIARFVQDSLERPRTYTAVTGEEVELTIGCEYKLGTSWKGEVEWKNLPSREVMTASAHRLVSSAV
jgi:uracil-DNA glycosylase family 4